MTAANLAATVTNTIKNMAPAKNAPTEFPHVLGTPNELAGMLFRTLEETWWCGKVKCTGQSRDEMWSPEHTAVRLTGLRIADYKKRPLPVAEWAWHFIPDPKPGGAHATCTMWLVPIILDGKPSAWTGDIAAEYAEGLALLEAQGRIIK